MRTLQQCLLDTDVIRLRVIARYWDVDLALDRRRVLAAQLAEAMVAPRAVDAALDALPDEQAEALSALLAEGGQMPMRVFVRRWGDIRAMGPGRMERERPWREPISPTEGLWYRGFVHRAFAQGADGAYEVIFVPRELQAHLPEAAPEPCAFTVEPVPAPVDVRSDRDVLLEDACTLLAYLQTMRVRPTAEGHWPARQEGLLIQRLCRQDPDRVAFLHHLARTLGWLRVTDSRHLRPEPEASVAWLQSASDDQRRALVCAWRDDPAWNDLFHVPTLRPEDTGAWRNEPLLARRAILRHLAACEVGAWYRLTDFVAAIKAADPDFQRPSGDYATWYIRDAATGAYLSGFESWDAVEGALIGYVVTAPLHWLGLVDLSADDGPLCFCISRAGGAFLDIAEAPPASPPPPLEVRADFTVHVPLGRRYERFQLARVADWASTPARHGARSDAATFVYRLTPSSLARARQQGIPVARILTFLEQAADGSVPHFLETALTRWSVRGAEVRLEQVVLLRFASEELMAQALASPPVRRLIREQVGPQAALVRRSDWPHLVAALGEMGLVPDVVGLVR